MGWGVDFYEKPFGALMLRCDTLLANVEVFDRETGAVVALFVGTKDLRAGFEFHPVGSDMRLARGNAIEALRHLDEALA